MPEILVAKIGGSTLGSHDTTLEDIVELQRRGVPCVVVHGGGALISDWLGRAGITPRFERGLRVTDDETLRVVVAVLAGLVNKEIVASLNALGAKAVGLSGADGGLLQAKVADEKLGLVGEITGVDTTVVCGLLEAALVPVIAPIATQWNGERPTAQLLNINADTAAGAIAEALGARWLIFLTDVEGVRAADGSVMARLSIEEARGLIAQGVIGGGMIPKVESCLRGAQAGCVSVISDGRQEHALLAVTQSEPTGTTVG